MSAEVLQLDCLYDRREAGLSEKKIVFNVICCVQLFVLSVSFAGSASALCCVV